jgi:succinoglycan biosynthesis transport protein ExoP
MEERNDVREANNEMAEIDLGRLARAVWRHIGLVVIVALVFALGTMAVKYSKYEQSYKSSFSIFVNDSRQITESTPVNYNTSAAAIISSRDMLKDAAERAGLDYGVSDLESFVSAEAQDGTQLVNVHVTMKDRNEAYGLAKALEEIAPDYISNTIEGCTTKIVAKAHKPAQQNGKPDFGKTPVKYGAVGAILAILAIIVVELMDKRVKSQKQVERQSGIPVIGTIPDFAEAAKVDQKVKTSSYGHSADLEGEAYKSLRSSVLFSLKDSDSKVIGLTGAMPGDGGTANAVNLAKSLGQLGGKVLLMDCDLREPVAASKLGIESAQGLSDVLKGQVEVGVCIQRSDKDGVSVLSAGSVPSDSTILLQSQKMETLIGELEKSFDYIIMDLPPVLTGTDAEIMSRFCSGFLLVVRHNATDKRALETALNRLQKVNAHMIGIIYNDIPAKQNGYYRYLHKNKRG